jgi:periplasmic divalent cation tolerance protein
MNSDYCVVVTTFADDANGKEVIDALISERLAACVQVFPIQSYYHWKGDIECQAEKLAFIKTKASLFSKVQDSIVANHAYETPEVIQLSIEHGLPEYLNWIAAECK